MPFIYLNVDGTQFQAPLDTIERIPLIKAYFDNVSTDDEEVCGLKSTDRLFLDRNYRWFEEIYSRIAFPSALHTKIPQELTEEMVYYGFNATSNDEDVATNDDADDGSTASLSWSQRVLLFEVENIINNPTPFYVSACGTIYQTTQDRLRKAHYFDAMFATFCEGRDETLGSQDNPLFMEITPQAFYHLLKHLRNELYTIPSAYRIIEDIFLIAPPELEFNAIIEESASSGNSNTKQSKKRPSIESSGSSFALLALTSCTSVRNYIRMRTAHEVFRKSSQAFSF